MRLSSKDASKIKDQALAIFGPNVKVYLFGSRIDDLKKGGDIDLLICPDTEISDARAKMNTYHVKLIMALGDQKIDILMKRPQDQRPIVATALQTGIEL